MNDHPSKRYLFGPVSGTFAKENLYRPRQDGNCLCFNSQGDGDLLIADKDTWNQLASRFPDSWYPDFVVVNLSYTTIPVGLWSAPVPLVAIAGDWNLLWHYYRLRLSQCDLVFTDGPGAEIMNRAGFAVQPAILYGTDGPSLESGAREGHRDIDILFVGNLSPAVQQERLAWLGRLARLADRWRVVICGGVYGNPYRQMLQRARIVFNRSIRGECNRRVFEAAAAGALVFQEEDNEEAGQYFRDGFECVFYNDLNLESRLEHFLIHENQRQSLAVAGRKRAQELDFGHFWHEMQAHIEQHWTGLVDRSCQRRSPEPTMEGLARTWQFLNNPGADPSLPRYLEAMLVEGPTSTGERAALFNALGVILALSRDGRPANTRYEAALSWYAKAAEMCPHHVQSLLNGAEILNRLGRSADSVAWASRALGLVERDLDLDWLPLDGGWFPGTFDHFRVEWERAAWKFVGRPAEEMQAKRDLLRWRLHSLLATLTGELSHHYEAVFARPDIAPSRAALGISLAHAGKRGQAIYHLEQAVRANPFDRCAARELYHAHVKQDSPQQAQAVARESAFLAQAAPDFVPVEPWFVAQMTSSGALPPLAGKALPAERPTPTGRELASIIVLVCNQIEFTRLCLESVLQYTRAPYELILVDNGSSDGTPDYLAEVARRPEPVRVVVLRNANNRGFPAGCNQGIGVAQGEYLVFLNNDTIVTERWLDLLVACSLCNWPKVGMVGPLTNLAGPPQQIAVSYDNLQSMHALAAQRRQEFRGLAFAVDRLIGFCLLARREVFQRGAGFDERYGLGFLDDDDLSLQVRQAGFDLVVARDVFIHHFGGQTFRGLGIDRQQQMDTNREVFRQKWSLPLDSVASPKNGPSDLDRVRAHQARKEYANARQILEELIRKHPQALDLRRVHCSVLTEQQEDLPALEMALRELIFLDPTDGQVVEQLGQLLRRLGRERDIQIIGQPDLSYLYSLACRIPSDINEHCPTLYALAKECQTVTEMGTRTGISTIALLHAQPQCLNCYDLQKQPHLDRLQGIAGRTTLAFYEADVRRVDIAETDLLFVDTLHIYEQLKEELRRHADQVRRYIVLHDTTTFADQGELLGHRGLWPAIEEFLARKTFQVKHRYANNNGLTILERQTVVSS